MKTLYEILGIEPSSTQDEIRKAYRAAAHKIHPDRNHGDPEATIKFQELQRAYAILSDPDLRKEYDRTGNADEVRSPASAAKEAIGTLFVQALEANSYAKLDYLTVIRRKVELSRDAMVKEELGLKKKIGNAEYILTHTTAADEILDAVRSKVAEMQGRAEHVTAALKVVALALSILKECSHSEDLMDILRQKKPQNTYPNPGGQGIGHPYISRHFTG